MNENDKEITCFRNTMKVFLTLSGVFHRISCDVMKEHWRYWYKIDISLSSFCKCQLSTVSVLSNFICDYQGRDEIIY